MEQIVQALPKNSEPLNICYMWEYFTHLLEVNQNEGVFVRPDIPKLFDSNLKKDYYKEKGGLDII